MIWIEDTWEGGSGREREGGGCSVLFGSEFRKKERKREDLEGWRELRVSSKIFLRS